MKYYKIVLLVTFVIFSKVVLCQDTLQKFVKNLCYYKTDGKVKSYGLKIGLQIPCAWDSLNEERPLLVKS